ncbi:type II toxin-antitoxin system RelE/ParE family toxin [Pseudomonas cerasi]
MAEVTIEYTETARSTLIQLRNHLIACGVAPLPVIERIIEEFESKVSAFPVGCQLCPELLKIGSDRYRECNTQKGYRVLYSVDGLRIRAHAVLSQRQDIVQLLYQRLIEF